MLAGTSLVGLSQLVWAGPRGGRGGIGDGAHFGGGHVSSYAGGFRGAPLSSSGAARFTGGTVGAVTRTPQQFYYYSGNRTSGLTQHAFVPQTPNRSITQYAGSMATVTHQQNRALSAARQDSRIGNSQMATATVRRTIANHNVARHDANWHHDWDKHRFHHHNGLVFVFLDGFWWGLSPAYFPWDYYPYYAYGDNPYDYYDYPYDYNDTYPYSYYDDQGESAGSDEYGNATTVSAVQSALAKLGYYHGTIDGMLGDATQAALAHYQQDRDLSVTGTLTAATLQSLGLRQTAS